MTDLSQRIKQEAFNIGFNACGISKAEYLSVNSEALKHWLSNGFHGEMKFMENHFEKRCDASLLLEGTKSVVSVAINYYNIDTQEDSEAPILSHYAYGTDYHEVLKSKLFQLQQKITELVPDAKCRCYVDSAPIFDKAYANRAGIGWIGKNTLLLTPEFGSYVFLGEIVLDIDLAYDTPAIDRCGTCNRCIESCPTKALLGDRVLDARKCIAYQTIETESEIEPQLLDIYRNERRFYGCDICQEVCPWNQKAIQTEAKEFLPLSKLLQMTKIEWLTLNENEFKNLFSNSSIKRRKFSGLKRNLELLK